MSDRRARADAGDGVRRAARCAQRRRRAGARRRLGPAAQPRGALPPGRAALRRPQGGPPAPGDGVRRDPGAHPQRRAGRGLLAEVDGAAVGRLRQLARRDDGRDLAAADHQEGPADAAPRPGRPRPCRPLATTGPSGARLEPSTTRCSSCSASATADGKVKPSRMAKFRQVQDLLAALDPLVDDAVALGPGDDVVADSGRCGWSTSGCGNAYLTFAAFRYLTAVKGLPVARGRRRRQGAGARAQHRGRRAARRRRPAARSWRARSTRSSSTEAPDLVLALHACDTATDDALARAVALAGAGHRRGAVLPPRHPAPARAAPSRRRRTGW